MKRDMFITKMESDFADGRHLIALVEMLSGRSVGKYNRTPKVHQHKLENVAIALNFLSEKEGIKLVNIGKRSLSSPPEGTGNVRTEKSVDDFGLRQTLRRCVKRWVIDGVIVVVLAVSRLS